MIPLDATNDRAMSGETEQQVSGWTVDTVHVHLLDLITDADRRYEQRFAAQEKAVIKAEIAAEKRFDSVNEFRAQLADQAATFMPRLEAEQRINAVADKIESRFDAINDKQADMGSRLDRNEPYHAIAARVDTEQGRTAGIDKTVALFLAVLAVLISLGGLAVALTR